jgi:HSP20 family protein
MPFMATTLTRWDPFNDLTSMRSVMDRLFDQSFGRFPGVRANEDLGPANLGIDVYETSTDYVVRAAVPGVDPKDIDISVEDEVLTIKGEFRHESEVNEDSYLRKELRTGSFQRSLRLPPTVDAEKASASFEHGVLKLSLPKKAEARAKSIKITPQGVIDAASADKPAA